MLLTMPRVIKAGFRGRFVDVEVPIPVSDGLPADATVRVQVRPIIRAVAGRHRRLIEAALLRGLRAKPPYSFAYLQLLAHYLDGKPSDKLELSGTGGGPIRLASAEQLAAHLKPEQLAVLEQALTALEQLRALPASTDGSTTAQDGAGATIDASDDATQGSDDESAP